MGGVKTLVVAGCALACCISVLAFGVFFLYNGYVEDVGNTPTDNRLEMVVSGVLALTFGVLAVMTAIRD